MQSPSSSASGTAVPTTSRGLQLIVGIVCMVMTANLQYGWTLFVHPMNVAHGWSVADIQIAFSMFVALETWLTPIEGWIVDQVGPKNGPRLMVAFGGAMIAIGWIVNSTAAILPMLYLGAVLSGIGRRSDLRDLHRQRGQVVSRPPRARRRPDRRRVRRGSGADRRTDPRGHRRLWLRGSFFLVWAGPGRGRLRPLAWLMRAPLPGETPATGPSG